jgi:hypothetical protein
MRRIIAQNREQKVNFGKLVAKFTYKRSPRDHLEIRRLLIEVCRKSRATITLSFSLFSLFPFLHLNRALRKALTILSISD